MTPEKVLMFSFIFQHPGRVLYQDVRARRFALLSEIGNRQAIYSIPGNYTF